MQYTNKLISETSPYLLQHAHNPVEWYPWGEEALHLAKELDKPLLVSIGYSACHWCHVMERESFEDEATAKLMNEYFINIKIDREERPDLDHIYMDAVQNMTGSGGWPLNVFLTPAGKPFYGGTYFPPSRAFNRASWKEVLRAVHDAYANKREEVTAQAENLTAHLANANNFGINRPEEAEKANIFNKQNLQQAAENILKNADTEWGGFGSAPKFPQTLTIQYLLRHYHFIKHQPSLRQALLSIDKIIQGGIYDHISGGFARYSTDNKWLVPHFEKMLYDNALLINVLSEAYQLTNDERYTEVITQTIEFIKKEMLQDENGFYSALDADSEGVEGKYYVWTKNEIDEILGEDSDLFCKIYSITDSGNWEHNNIIWLTGPLKNQLPLLNLDEKKAKERLKSCKDKLLNERSKRVRPALDDKILLGWNALMINAFCKAFSVTENQDYLAIAEKCIVFLEDKFSVEGWKHTYKNGQAKYPAFLDDYAYLIQAYIQLQEVTGNETYLIKAKELAENVIAGFSDEESLFFYFTPADQEDIVVRKKEMYDGATPSGNAVMAHNLYYLSVIFDIASWRKRAEEMAASLGQTIIKYPASFGFWASVLQNITEGMNEIAVVGENCVNLLNVLNRDYIPNKIIQAALKPSAEFPLLRDKVNRGEETRIYLCKDYYCSQPVTSIAEFRYILGTRPQ